MKWSGLYLVWLAPQSLIRPTKSVLRKVNVNERALGIP
jgi:hypothetical protein